VGALIFTLSCPPSLWQGNGIRPSKVDLIKGCLKTKVENSLRGLWIGKIARKWLLDYTVLNSCYQNYSTSTAVHQPYPLYPLPLGKGKGRIFERGASAPLNTLLF
jgi:hypothetical protein